MRVVISVDVNFVRDAKVCSSVRCAAGWLDCPTGPFILSEPQDQEISEFSVQRILKLKSYERVGRAVLHS